MSRKAATSHGKCEANAIAGVRSHLELTAPKQQQAKTHALKQVMIQELLTGRTRLPVQ